jgi:L-rhamnose-H+ transport protein
MAFAMDAAAPISEIAGQHLLANGRSVLCQGLAALIGVLLGGFVTKFIWCLGLNIRNRTTRPYVSSHARDLSEIAVAPACSSAWGYSC